MRFHDRDEAARLLAGSLSRYAGRHPLVLGIPRGGVPMARIIADALDGDLDVVLVHKLGAPANPELAIGAVDEQGRVQLESWAGEFLTSDRQRDALVEAEQARLQARRRQYAPVCPAHDPAGRTLIVVDDGVATGSSMLAALRSLRARHPARLVVALPVAAGESLRRLEQEADEVVCLYVPDVLYAVGAFYDDFSSVSDDEVVAALRRNSAHTV